MTLDLAPLWLTLKLAGLSTVLLLLIGTPLAWWLARSRSRVRTVVEALIALPLVLPSTVLGFYLLLLLSPQGAVGGLWQTLGGQNLAFSFSGLLIGSVIYSLPFVVQPLQNSFQAVGEELLEAAAVLRASAWDAFRTVAVPLSARGFLTATVLGFTHTIGEFGIVMMIGGNIPGRTQTLSIAIYDHVEALRYNEAHILAGGLVLFSFAGLLLIYLLNRRMTGEQHSGR